MCRLISIQKGRQTGVCFHDENFVTSLTHTNDDNSPLRRICSIFLFAAPSLSTNSNFELGHLNLIRVFDLSSIYFSDFPLQTLSLSLLSAKLAASSGRIQEKQESLGSKGVNIRSYNDPGLKTSNVMNRVMGYVYHTNLTCWIPTLQLIELTRCLPKLGESAARIQQEQQDLGNNPVDVRISEPLPA
ncbi:hypothetical protein P3S68_033862 [Capsicum galapagoense]